MILKEYFRGQFPMKAAGTRNMVVRSKIRKGTSLEISAVKEEDAGRFICEADGRRQEHTLVVVSVSASPSADLQLGSEATLQCKVAGLDPVSTGQWKGPDGRPTSESNVVELKPITHSDAGTWVCTFSHDGRTHDFSLDIKVQGPAPQTAAPPPSQTSGDKSSCSGCGTAPPASALLLGLSWWVWVAGGVGCLVVVLLVVFVIVLCKRIKRRKRKFLTMKNGQHPLKSKPYCQCDRPAAAKPRQGRRREKPSAPPLQPLLIQ